MLIKETKMVLQTQSNSRPRLKNDTLGDEALKTLYSSYKNMDREGFRVVAEEIVQAGGGKQKMKTEIISSFEGASKEKILAKAQNFILAGMGLGV
jgi:hypothetical protein